MGGLAAGAFAADPDPLTMKSGILLGARARVRDGGAGAARPPRLKFPLLISVDRNLCLVCAIGLTLVVALLLHLGGAGELRGLPHEPLPRAHRPLTPSSMRSTFRRLVQPASDTRVDLAPSPSGKHVLALYFPQFHEFEVNNVLWGKGYTDFKGVEAAQVARHGYPVIRPLDGTYNLLDYWTRHRQARVARQYGIHGFVYYHYWFSGGPVMEAPLLALLEDDEPNIPFALSWANEHWTRRWDGGNNEVLMEQRYEPSDSRPHFDWLLKFFQHKNYILRDNKPMLLIYRSADVPALQHVVAQWNAWALEAGFAGLYVVQMNGVLWSQTAWELQPGVKGIAEFYPNLYASVQLRPSSALWANYHTRFNVKDPSDYFFGVHASFNNKPRHLTDGRETVLPYHPVNLRHALRTQLSRTANDSFVFLNAWNEWGEGEAVEPSVEFGHSWLQAIKDAIADDASGIEGPILPMVGIPWVGDGLRSGGVALGVGAGAAGAAEAPGRRAATAGVAAGGDGAGAMRDGAPPASNALQSPLPQAQQQQQPSVCIVILTDGTEMDGSPKLFTLRHHLDTLVRLERRQWVGFVVDVGGDGNAFNEAHLKEVVEDAEEEWDGGARLQIVQAPGALRSPSTPSSRYLIADAMVARHCLGMEEGADVAAGLRGAPAAPAAAASAAAGSPARPIAPWFLVTSAADFYTPDALNYLPEDADLVVMNFHSRNALAAGSSSGSGEGGGSSGGGGGEPAAKGEGALKAPSNCCTRLATYQCPPASPRIGSIDLGGMVFSSYAYAGEGLGLGQFLDACSHPEAPCPDGALAQHVDARLNWRTRFHPAGACALYHNPSPVACGLVGGLFYDTDDASKATCFEPPDFPIALSSVDWGKFAGGAGCVCER